MDTAGPPPSATPYRDAIRRMHGCEAIHVETVPVRETFKGQVVWEGEVEVFDVIGHSTARRCYAWSYAAEGTRRRFYAVPHAPPVDSPIAAVRASVVAGPRARQQ